MEGQKLIKGLIILVYTLSTFLSLSFCSLIVPDQFHSISRVHLRNKNSLGLGFDWLMVDEYVDKSNYRSSLKISDLQLGNESIYYNEVSNEKYSFLVYDVDKNTCKSSSHYNWPLANFKNLVMRILPISFLTRLFCDVALGPSAFLVAIEETLDDFYYVETKYNYAGLSNVDIYERTIGAGSRTLLNDKSLLITVRLMSDTLTSADGKSPTKKPVKKESNLAGVARTSKDIHIVSLAVCEVQDVKLKDKTKNKEYMCTDEETIVDIDYYVLARINSEQLLGDNLEETSEFDYHKEPFLPPVGIGCSSTMDIRAMIVGGLQKKFNAPGMKFSAEYTTYISSQGVSFVAYDGYREVLRLDRDGRKSVYDLRKGFSYHESDEFHSMNRIGNDTELSRSCISMDDTDETLISARMMERLIGVGVIGQTSASHLGTRTIDQIPYEVYELELEMNQIKGLAGYNLPILMQSSRFVMPKKNVNREQRFFMIYYVTEHKREVSITGYSPDVENHGEFEDGMERPSLEKVLIPKYIELWVSKSNFERIPIANLLDIHHRTLINRLEFTQFSWELDVEPTSDSDSQDLGQLFNIESCAQERSNQLQYRVLIGQNEMEPKNLAKWEALKKQSTQIKEVLHEKIGELLEISRLNIAHLDLGFVDDTGDLIVEARIIELVSSASDDTILGYVEFPEFISTMRQSVISINQNTHTLDSCKLDSLSSAYTEATLMYCKGLTVCVLLHHDEMKNYPNIYDKTDAENNPNPKKTLCELHRYKWVQKPVERSDSVLVRAIQNNYRLYLMTFDYYYILNTESDSKQKIAKKLYYTGSSRSVDMKDLDPVGGPVGFGDSPFVGVRYLSVEEEKELGTEGSNPMNFAIRLTESLSGDKFKYCERACRLEEYCESFSFCLRKKNLVTQNDCVLSNMRLTGERYNLIETLIRDGKKMDDLGIRIENPLISRVEQQSQDQVIKFKTDEECNIYYKDILGEFEQTYSFKLPELDAKKNITRPKPRQVPLEECAALSYEKRLLSSYGIPSEFTYCPFGSACTLSGEELFNSMTDHRQICMVYQPLKPTKFYQKHSNARMTISVEGLTKSKSLDETKSAMFDLKIGRLFQGLDDEQCARECNLHLSNCLAFDVCRNDQMETVCLLYSIRSPISPRNTKHGLLPQEVQFYGQGAGKKEGSQISLGSGDCSHYYIRDTFLDIKLDRMLEHQENSYWQQVEKKEKLLIDEDQQRSDQFLDELERSRISELADSSTGASGGALNLLLLFVGVSVGLLLTLYGTPVSLFLCDALETYRVKRRARHNGPRISQLDLTNNLEL